MIQFTTVSFLPAATKLGQGNVFTGLCDSVHGGSASVHAGIPPPPPRSRPPWSRPPLPRGETPPEADSGIRSTSGRYASYWNAFLFLAKIMMIQILPKNKGCINKTIVYTIHQLQGFHDRHHTGRNGPKVHEVLNVKCYKLFKIIINK